MVATQTATELPLDEQIRMTVDEAGEKYDGYFIFFTNTEEILIDGRWEEYAIPRVIALNNNDFCKSELSKKFDNRSLYGIPFSCSFFMAEEQIPPILTF